MKTGFWSFSAPLYDLFTSVFMGRQYRQMKAWAATRLPPGAAVLELAAGTGALTKALAPRAARYVATDLSESMLEALRRLPGIEVAAHDATRPWPETGFDAVIMGNVLHLLPDPILALRAAREALKPGGTLLAPTFCHGATRLSRTLSGLIRRLGFPVRHRLSPASLRAMAEEAGLRVASLEIAEGVFPLGLLEAERSRES